MDPEEFFIDEFTVPVVLPNNSTTTGIFDNLSASAFDITAPAPQLTLRQADAVTCHENDILLVDLREYRIKHRDAPEDGVVLLHLETLAPL